MTHLLLIDVAACVALIMVAALVMVMRWRRRRPPRSMPGRPRRRAVAENSGDGLAPGRAAVVPGFSRDGARPDPGAHTPLEPEQAARAEHPAQTAPARHPQHAAQPKQVAQVQHVAQTAPARQPGRAAGAGQPPGAAPPQQVRDGRGAAHPQPSLNGPGAAPGEQPDTGGVIPDGERIGSYYDEADQPMSDYLAELGWTAEPGTHDPQ
jgi:hypothetical protein